MTHDDPALAKFLDGITPEKRRRDAATLIDVMERVTGLSSTLTGTILGFGQYHYRYPSGREGDAAAAAFSPRKASTVVYLPDGIGAHASRLERLGPHSTGVGCLYVKDLESVDLAVLEQIIDISFHAVTSDTFGTRTRQQP